MVVLVRTPSGLRAYRVAASEQRNSHPARPHRSRCRVVQARSLDDTFDLGKYHEAHVTEVRSQENFGNVILLKLKDGLNSVLPVYIGEHECNALVKEINKKPAPRPGTHDLMRTMLEALGHRVAKVRISSLVGNTYHAKIHFKPAAGTPGSGASGSGAAAPGAPVGEVEVDARPSDAINLAVRFGAPIYVNKEVASRMAEPAPAAGAFGAAGPAGLRGGAAVPRDEGAKEIVRSCREEIMHYADPTIMIKLQLGVAIAEDRFEEASRLRDAIDRMLASDRALSLVVAIETALEDGRYDEAARLREEFRRLRAQQAAAPPRLSDIVDL